MEALVACSSLPDTPAEDPADAPADLSTPKPAAADAAGAGSSSLASPVAPAIMMSEAAKQQAAFMTKMSQSPRCRNYRLLVEEMPAAHRYVWVCVGVSDTAEVVRCGLGCAGQPCLFLRVVGGY